MPLPPPAYIFSLSARANVTSPPRPHPSPSPPPSICPSPCRRNCWLKLHLHLSPFFFLSLLSQTSYQLKELERKEGETQEGRREAGGGRKGEGRRTEMEKICLASQRSSRRGSAPHPFSPREHSVHESACLAGHCPPLTPHGRTSHGVSGPFCHRRDTPPAHARFSRKKFGFSTAQV